jgi:hypothetical protein
MLLVIIIQMATHKPVPFYVDSLVSLPVCIEPIINAVILYRFDSRIRREVDSMWNLLMKRIGLQAKESDAVAPPTRNNYRLKQVAIKKQLHSPNILLKDKIGTKTVIEGGANTTLGEKSTVLIDRSNVF